MRNALVRLIGWPATILHGDPSVLDRWCWLRKNLRGGAQRTLDAGCGSGGFAMYAAKRGHEAVGVTFDAGCAQVAEQRARMLGLSSVRFITADLRQLDRLESELGAFDQIICFETIEHIRDDQKLLRDMSRLLKPGGRLLLTAPYRLCRPLLGDGVSEKEDGGHVRWGYTHEELEALCRAQGLEVVQREFVSGWVTQRLVNLVRRLSFLGRLGWGLAFPLRVFQAFDRPITALLRYPYLSVAIVATKPS